MANKGTIFVELIVDDKGTIKVKRFSKEAERAFDKSEKGARGAQIQSGKLEKSFGGLGSAASRLGPLIAGAFSVYAITSFIETTISAASNLEEVTNKFNVVFEGQIALAEEWTKTLQEGFLMSEREARQYLSSIQDLLVPMGMNADAAGKLSFKITKLSADLGSFNNLPTAQVMSDIQSALVGNYETMKKYGVVINATIVQEKALAMGLAKTKDELTTAQKAQAAYTLMVEDSQAAIGDVARSSDSYANTQKKLKAATEDLAATMGDILLPTATEATSALADFVQVLDNALKEWQRTRLEVQIGSLEMDIARIEEHAKDTDGFLWRWLGQRGLDKLPELRAELIELQERLRALDERAGKPLGPPPIPPEEMPEAGFIETGERGQWLPEPVEGESILEQKRAQMEEEIALEQEKFDQLHELFANASAQEEALREQNKARAIKIKKAEMQGLADITSDMGNALIMIGRGQSKTMFEMGKAFAIASAMMRIPNAAIGAYEALSWIPMVGPALGAAAAAAAIAFGMAQAELIRRQSYEPRALGGPVYPGEAYWVGERGPEPFIPDRPGRIVSNRDARNLGGASVFVSEIRIEFPNIKDADSLYNMDRTAFEDTIAEALREGIAKGVYKGIEMAT